MSTMIYWMISRPTNRSSAVPNQQPHWCSSLGYLTADGQTGVVSSTTSVAPISAPAYPALDLIWIFLTLLCFHKALPLLYALLEQSEPSISAISPTTATQQN